MILDWPLVYAWLVGFSVTVFVGWIVLTVQSIFGTQYHICDCGSKCAISDDGWFYWQCECGQSGKEKPY